MASAGSENNLRRVAGRRIVSAALNGPEVGAIERLPDSVRRRDFPFSSDLVDAILKALGV